jgi:CheY-like chemotaxis protein
MNPGINKLVLVAENDENDVVLLKRTIDKLECPHGFRFVPDGEAAIAYLEGDAPFANRLTNPLPDLLLLDLNLPLVSGFDVLEWVFWNQKLRDLKVIVWSGRNKPGDIQAAERFRVTTFVPKDGLDSFYEVVSRISWLLQDTPTAPPA